MPTVKELDVTLREKRIAQIRGARQKKTRLWLVMVERDDGKQFVGKAADFGDALEACLSRMDGGLIPSNQPKAY